MPLPGIILASADVPVFTQLTSDLAAAGYPVKLVASVAQCVRSLISNPAGILVLDLAICNSEAQGWDVLKQARDAGAAAIVLLAGESEEDYALGHALKSVCRICLPWPCSSRGLLFHIQDILARKQPAAEPLERLRLQADVLDQIQDSVVVTDVEGRILYVNQAVCHTLQKSSAMLIGKTIQMFGEDPQQGPSQQEILTAALRDGQWQGEVTNYAAGGRKIVYKSKVRALYDSLGQPAKLVGVSTDITRLKEVEEKLRESNTHLDLAMESAREAKWEWIISEGLIALEARTWQILGYDKERAVTTMAWLKDRIHPNDREAFSERINACLRGDSQSLQSVFRIQTHTGKYAWIQSHGKVIERDPRGYPLLVVGIFRDITEFRHMEQQVRHAHKMRAIGTLTSGIAHDFNNILTSIIGFSELAMDKGDATVIHDYMAEILSAGKRAKNLVKQLLTFSRNICYEKTHVELRGLVQQTFSLLRAGMPASIAIHTHMPKSPVYIRADENLVQQVIVNLAANACQTMRETGGSLTISLHTEQERPPDTGTLEPCPPGSYACLSLSDTGPGISQAELSKMFEPYADTATAVDNGLGMAVAHEIVKAHQGCIRVRSQVGRGATFLVYLPASEKPADKEKTVKPPAPVTGHILLLDDEPQIIKLQTTMLKRMGCCVSAFSNALEAWDAFRKSPKTFDLVITDMTMAHMNGLELAGKIKDLRPDIPVILATGYSDKLRAPDDADRVDGFLAKPFLRSRLHEVLHKLLSPKGRT